MTNRCSLPSNTVVLDPSGNIISGDGKSKCGLFNLSLSEKDETYRDKKCTADVKKFKEELRKLLNGETDVITLAINCPVLNSWSVIIGVPIQSEMPRNIALMHFIVEDPPPLSLQAINKLAGEIEGLTQDSIMNRIMEPPRKARDFIYDKNDAGDTTTLCLTGRQKDVLQGIIKGHSNKEIANEIGISYQTVKIHVSEILRRLKVKNRTEAAIMALTNTNELP